MRAKQVLIGGLLVALGVLLPMTSHITGVGGPIFLPMHIPVLFAGIILGPGLGSVVGLLTPVLSHLLTGMPPVSPMPILPMMVVELMVYGWAMGFLVHRHKVNPWVALVGSMVLGRVALGLSAAAIGALFDVPLNAWVYLQGAIVSGLPGIILQLVVVPPIAQRFFLSRGADSPVEQVS